MKYKALTLVLVVILVFSYITSLAAEYEYEFPEQEYDFEFSEAYCGSTGKVSRKINIKENFEDMSFYDNIYQIFIEYIIVGGNEGKGIVLNYYWPWNKYSSGLFQVPNNPGDGPICEDDNEDEKTITEYEISGLGPYQAYAIKAEEGEIYFKEMRGKVAYGDGYKSFIIRFKQKK